MADKKEKKVVHTSPQGTAVYPRILGEPDTKFNPEGVWSIKLKFKSLSEPGVQALIDRIDAVIEQAGKEAKADADFVKSQKKRGKKVEPADRSYTIDPDNGEVVVSFKSRASGISKKTNRPWERKVAVFDKYGKPVAPDTKVGGGSLCKVAFTLNPFYTAIGYGCSIGLEAVQILELVEWGQGTAEQYGFDAEEFEGDEDEESTAATGSEEDADDEDATDDDF